MKILSALVVLVALAVPAFAQNQGDARRYEIGWNVLSFSRQNSLNMWGGNLSFAAKATPRISVVADLAVHTTPLSGLDLTITNYGFGPRFYFQRAKRISTFGQFLIGGTQDAESGSHNVYGGTTITSSFSRNGFAMALGGGIDIGIKPWIALRVPEVGYMFYSHGGTQNDARIGSGIVFRFGH